MCESRAALERGEGVNREAVTQGCDGLAAERIGVCPRFPPSIDRGFRVVRI